MHIQATQSLEDLLDRKALVQLTSRFQAVSALCRYSQDRTQDNKVRTRKER